MKQVLDNLEFLSSLKGDLGLKEAMGVGVESGSGSKVSQKLPSTSLVVENVIYDRDADKEIIFNWLTSGADNCNQLSILSIVGMDGMGKTTLAQHVYNDPRMEEAKFDIKAWVCVSDDFDVLRVTRAILDAITKSKNEGGDLETVHEKLIGKRFLLVLDAVWNEKHKKWEAVQTPLNYGAQGSKILITTRNKEEGLIQLWMAENLLQFPQQNKSLKEVGEQYYDDLLSKSFFQQSSEDEALFFMHDLLNDLAKYVCGDIYFSLYDTKRLRTFMPISRRMDRMFDGWHCKMSIQGCLSGCSGLTELNWCENFEELPSNLYKLTNLHFIAFRQIKVRKVPMHLGKLKNLHVLSTFCVGKSREFGIQQLGELNLRESLSIGELQNIENPSYALAADLKNKIHLVGLRLGWNWNQNQIPDDPKKEREVLENLTFEVLEKFVNQQLWWYRISKMLFDDSLSNVVSLYLVRCKYCLCLPPLGHLPFLKTLNIQRLDGIVSIDSSFHGSSSSSFTSLETLEFYCLKEWECRAVTGAFPRLQRLCIVECPKLKGSLPEQLLCLKILLFLTANSLWLLEICELELQDCGKIAYTLKIVQSSSLSLKKELWEPTPLKSLYIQNLDVESFPDEGLLPLSLKRIQIDKCRNLLNFYNKGLCQLSSLEELSLGNNPNLQCLPEEGLPKSISTLDILDCTLLKQRCLGPKGEDWGNIIHIKNNLSVAGLDGKLIIDSEFQGRHQENSEGHKIQNVVAMKKVQNPQSDKRDDQLPTRAFESPLRC
ncbi:putative disease resistance protein RGA4 [Glycine soja]|uniref:Putative disease resistance protein RGA4 n=1 Tax=Glycine soja TaxID=3848 RepID=A0A445JM64_GLYSO|nr:putative disease resistance protein RGA4 [Glycine soja]